MARKSSRKDLMTDASFIFGDHVMRDGPLQRESAEAQRPWYRDVEPMRQAARQTLLEAFLALEQRHDIGIVLLPERADGQEEERSYGQIVANARRRAADLQARGVQPGDAVVMVLPTGFEFVEVFFAVQLIGAVPVPSYPPALMEKAEQSFERLSHIVAKMRCRFLITNAQLRPLFGELLLRNGSLRDVFVSELGAKPLGQPAPVQPESTCFVQFTSGSTGAPKGVELSHRAVVANIVAVGQATEMGPADKGISWLPLYHDMGLIGALFCPMFWQYPLVLMSPLAFLMQPGRFLRAITHHRATISAAPNFAYALCVRRVRPAEREGLDLSSWRLAFNGAEPVNLRTLVDFQRSFGPRGFRATTMFPVYGLAECSLAVAYSPPREPFKYKVVDRDKLLQGIVISATDDNGLALVSVGKAVPGHEVRVVDDKGNDVPDKRVGQIIVRGPSLMTGYYGDPEATARALRDGWLWTGDLGFFSNSSLYITGRVKNLIIVRGKNYFAEDIERVAERVPGVRGGGSAAFAVYDEDKASDRVVLLCEVRLEDAADKAALITAVGERVSEDCGLKLDEVVLVEPGTIPKTSSGKRQRERCRELYLAGELKPQKTTRSKLAWIVVRSGLGFVRQKLRRVIG